MDRKEIANIIEAFVDNGIWGEGKLSRLIDLAMKGGMERPALASLLMAIKCKGLSDRELIELTNCYAKSGKQLYNKSLEALYDKHSTGGVGDKLTFLIAPIIAASGRKFRKLSGRSLRHCSGTIDKLSDVDNFNHISTLAEFEAEVERMGFSIMPQSGEVCPADALTYSCRDECGSTGSVDLIAASIMSKKIATGANNLILDVKFGSGGLVADIKFAEELAKKMLMICSRTGIKATVALSPMEIPLGNAIGGAYEVSEAMYLLQMGNIDSRLVDIAIKYCVEMIAGAEGTNSEELMKEIENVVKCGKAADYLAYWLRNRGVDVDSLVYEYLNPQGTYIIADHSGYISQINAPLLGLTAQRLAIVGKNSGNILIKKTVGEWVSKGDVIAVVVGEIERQVDKNIELVESIASAFTFESVISGIDTEIHSVFHTTENIYG